MKILFINHFPLTGSGSGVYTVNLARSLTRLGHECAIVYPENEFYYDEYYKIKQYPVFFNGMNDGLKFNFPCFTTHPRSSFNFKDMSDIEKDTYGMAFVDKVLDVLTEFKPDVVHSQHLWTLSGVAANICETYKIPLIVTCHGTDIIGIKDEEKRNDLWGTVFAKKAYDYATNIITISKDNKKLLEEIFGKNDKVLYIKNGVDEQTFHKDDSISKEEVLKELKVDNEYKNIISFVGKLTHIKGVDTLLKALSIIRDNSILTLIAGDGELRKELENKAKELKLNNIVFLGNLPQDELNRIYNIVDLSVVPSRSEAFGLVAAEANMCGAPVVATNVGGLPEIVTRDKGLIIDVDDERNLANSINYILNNKNRYNRDNIAKDTKQKYSQETITKKVEKIYKNNNPRKKDL